VAICVVVNSTRCLADPQVFERQFERGMNQVCFENVCLEVYRNRQFATDAEITAVKYLRSPRAAMSASLLLA
jgi:hypothetical protein